MLPYYADKSLLIEAFGTVTYDTLNSVSENVRNLAISAFYPEIDNFFTAPKAEIITSIGTKQYNDYLNTYGSPIFPKELLKNTPDASGVDLCAIKYFFDTNITPSNHLLPQVDDREPHSLEIVNDLRWKMLLGQMKFLKHL